MTGSTSILALMFTWRCQELSVYVAVGLITNVFPTVWLCLVVNRSMELSSSEEILDTMIFFNTAVMSVTPYHMSS